MQTINHFISSLLFVGAASGLLWTTSAARGGVVITNLHSFSAFPEGANPQSALVQGTDGDFYGTTQGGGLGGGHGTVFKITPKGVLTSLYSFTGLNDGSYPNGLVLGADGNFYGTTQSGGTNGGGTVFKITARGMLTTLYAFSYGAGGYPLAALVKGSDGDLYGTTSYGGANGNGTVFKITGNGALTTLHSFMGTNDGASPYAALVEGKDGSFYGTTRAGGDYSSSTSGNGTVFKITSNGAFTSLYSFSGGSDGANPQAALAQGKDGSFYGTTIYGGQDGVGTVFNVTKDGTFTSLYSFTYVNDGGGRYPQAGLIQGAKGDFYGTTYSGGTNGSGAVFQITTAGALTTLYSFTGGNGGAYPKATLALGSDGNYYGTTQEGGTNGNGTVFKITPNGMLTSLFSFPGLNDGNSPNGLVLGADGSFYGTDDSGGTNNDGVVFKITTNGAFTSLHSFDYSDGDSPNGLAPGSDGTCYGTTLYGGSNGSGTVFQITTNGVLTTLYSFDDGEAGGDPEAALVKGGDGNFYGTTSMGGSNNGGTIFRLTTNGSLATMYSFTNGSDGSDPQAAFALGMDGNLYGITLAGAAYGYGGVFRITSLWNFTNIYSFTVQSFNRSGPQAGLVLAGDGNFYGTTEYGGTSGNGSVFQITPNGTFTTLYSFTSVSNGYYPQAPLVPGGDGKLYGTTLYGGSNYYGTVFQITTNGVFTSLYSFPGRYDGANPQSALAPGSDGSLYGVTGEGGAGGYGIIFRISARPSIAVQPPALLHQLANSTLSLSATADGLPALAYQWQSNGVSLADSARVSGSDTANLTISPLALADAGSYRLIVSNSYGAVTSTVTVLTVSNNTVAPTIVIKSPGAGERTSSSLISGVAWGNLPVTNVVYWLTNLNDGKVVSTGSATLTQGETNWDWSFDLSNYPGTNLIGVQAWDASGLHSPVVARSLFFKVPTQLELYTLGNGNGTFTGSASVSGDVPPANGAMLNIGETYSITAIPGSNCFFTGWGGVFTPVGAATNRMSFIMESNTRLEPTFVTNRFLPMLGTYDGLFDLSGTASATVGTAGMIANLKVLSNGLFSGKLLMAGTNCTLTGAFDPTTGQAVTHLPPLAPFGGALEVDLALQWGSYPPVITGAVVGTNTVVIAGTHSTGWRSSDLELYARSAGTNISPSFTMLIPPVTTHPTAPPGYGYAVLANHAGTVTIVGGLADGTNFSLSVPIGDDNRIPIYDSLYKGAGLLFGRLALGTNGSVPSGSLAWIKPTTMSVGFTNLTSVLGSPWTNAPHLSAVILTNSELVLSGGALAGAQTNTVFITGANSLTTTGPHPDLTGTINPKTGLLNLTFKYEGLRISGKGAVLQNQGQAGGFFTNGSADGSILLKP